MTTTYGPWRPGVNGASARPWFVCRNVTGHPRGMPHEYHERSDGRLRRYASREAALRVADYLNSLHGRTDPGWGKPYGATLTPHYITHEGVGVWMHRKGQRVRFYDAEGNEHGVEQPNVGPAIAYAGWCGWRDPTAPDWLNDGLRAEVRTRTTFR